MSSREQLRKYIEMEYAIRHGRPGQPRTMNKIYSYFSSLRHPVKRLAKYKALQTLRGLGSMKPLVLYNSSKQYTRAELENFLRRPNVSQFNKNNIRRQLEAFNSNSVLRQQQQKVQQLKNLIANVTKLQQQIESQHVRRGGNILNKNVNN